MKKTYIQPSIEEVRLTTAITLLAGSETMNVKEGEASEWGSRRRGRQVWDDDDDDDF